MWHFAICRICSIGLSIIPAFLLQFIESDLLFCVDCLCMGDTLLVLSLRFYSMHCCIYIANNFHFIYSAWYIIPTVSSHFLSKCSLTIKYYGVIELWCLCGISSGVIDLRSQLSDSICRAVWYWSYDWLVWHLCSEVKLVALY